MSDWYINQNNNHQIVHNGIRCTVYKRRDYCSFVIGYPGKDSDFGPRFPTMKDALRAAKIAFKAALNPPVMSSEGTNIAVLETEVVDCPWDTCPEDMEQAA
jgi:hypothetical protein